MALNNSNKQVISTRREMVSYCRLRGLTQRQTVYNVNRKFTRLYVDGKIDKELSFSLGTINSDIKYLEKEWKKKAEKNINQYKSNILAELDEIKKQGWDDKNLNAVLSAISQQRAIMGLDMPAKTALTDPTGEHEAQVICLTQIPENLNDNGGNGNKGDNGSK